MKIISGSSIVFGLFLLAYSPAGFAGSHGNGASQRNAAGANGQNATPAPAQNAAPVPAQNNPPSQDTTPVLAPGAAAPAGAILLNAIPLGAVTATGGGHYQPLPVITNGGGRTLLAVAKGSRVQAYVDGVPGPVVNAIPVTQTLPQTQLGCTNGSPQFSADQKHVAYIVDLDNNKHAIVVDGVMSPAYDQINWLSFAPVGHHFAYSAQRWAGANQAQYASFVVDDGKAGNIYSQGCGPAVFSPDGNHVAYVASVYSKGLTPIEVQEGRKTPQNVCVVLDGVEQKHFAKIEQLTFSQDSKHLAYLAGIDQLTATRVVVDNQEGPAFSRVQQLVISDDGSRSACIATKTITNATPSHETVSQSNYVVVDNGKEGAPCDLQITHLCVSHDGRHVAYVAQGYKTNTVIIDNGTPSQQYRGCDTLLISPDSKTVLYIATGAQGQFIVVNGQEYGPFGGTFAPAFSPDGHWACCVTTGEQKFGVLADGKTIALNGIAPGPLAYQPGGQLVMRATTSYSGAPVMVEVNGAAIAAADVPSAIAYSPNHQHVAKMFTTGYGTSGIKQQVAIDGQPPTAATYTGVSNLAISDDGRHVAYIGSYIGENGKALTHAIYDGTEGPGYWGIKDLALSPDGLHVAYVAQKSNGHGIDTYVVIDGMEGPAFQDVLIDGAYSGQGMGAYDQYHQVRFEPDGSLHFLPVFNGQLYRCTYPAGAFKGLPSLATHEAEKPGPRDLHNFVRPNIFEDQAQAMNFVLGPDETIYGVSDADGKFKHGTLFKLKTDGTGFVVLHDFYGGDDDGQSPTSLVLLPDGSLFGMAEKGFRYDPKTQQFALVNMDAKDHVNMLAGCAPDGTIFGFGGGSVAEKRNVVSMAPDGSNYVSFANDQNAKPQLMYSQIVAGKDGTFFAIGMVQNKAALVKFKSLKDTPTLVHKFAALPTDGNRPEANLTMDSKGNLYGSTAAGGMSQNGVIYKVSADGSNYQVVYNPDVYAFSKAFVAGDDGMLYGISKEGLQQLAPDGSGKPLATVVAFDGANFDYTNHRGMTNIIFHHGAVYGMHGAAIYKVTLPQGGGIAATAAPTVAISSVQPAPLASEPIVFTDPSGAAVPATPSATPPAQQTAQQPYQQPAPPPATQPQEAQLPPPPPPQQHASHIDKNLQKAKDAADRLKHLFGQ